MSTEFNQIPGLIACWNSGVAGTTHASSGEVVSVDPAYSGLAVDKPLLPMSVVYDPEEPDVISQPINYGSAVIGSMPAWDAN